MSENRSLQSDFAVRCGITLAGTSVLLIASAVSGLPACTCTALAKTYMIAIEDFGAASIPVLFLYLSAHWPGGRGPQHTAVFVFFVISVVVFIVALLASSHNVAYATHFCFVGAPNELADHLHRDIPLASTWKFWLIFDGNGEMW
jgi:hypothetical protein